MDDFSFNTNFLGRDGFTWWIGQIAPYTDTEGNPLNSMIDGEESWGAPRYKVRIMGYHPYTTAELPDKDLPWALVMRPPGTGTGSGGMSKTIHFNQGDTVIGFFLDNENAQQPIIMGAIGNSKYAAKNGEVLPFGNFSGYTEDMVSPSSKVRTKSESSDIQEQPSPQSQTPQRTTGPRVSSMDGIIITNPCGGNDSNDNANGSQSLSDIKNAVQQFSDSVQRVNADFLEGSEFARDWIKQEIGIRTNQITGLASGLVNGMIVDLAEQLIPLIRDGLQKLYKEVFDLTYALTRDYAISRAAGLAAQIAMSGPIKFLQNQLPCIVNSILGRIGDTVKVTLNAIVDNVTNFVQCVADQTIGVLANDVIAQASEGLSEALNGIGEVMKFINAFNSPAEFIANLMRNTTGGLLGLIGVAGCNDLPEKDAMGPCRNILGVGPSFSNPSNVKAIIDGANGAIASGVEGTLGAFDIFNPNSKESGFTSELGGCYTGPPELCKPPKIKIFGGGGEGATANPIFGYQDSNSGTGSIIGIEITNPGSGYMYPPFVQVVDECGKGYGAIANAIVSDGKVNTIYMTSIGENYLYDSTDPVVVDIVDIINPGSGYDDIIDEPLPFDQSIVVDDGGDDGDDDDNNEEILDDNENIVKDDQGNLYKVQTLFGAITKVTPINIKDITQLPKIKINSVNGSGAVLLPRLAKRKPPEPGFKQVIDCIV